MHNKYFFIYLTVIKQDKQDELSLVLFTQVIRNALIKPKVILLQAMNVSCFRLLISLDAIL